MYPQNQPENASPTLPRQKLSTITPMLPKSSFTVPNSTSRYPTDPSSSFHGSHSGENPNDSSTFKKSQFYPGNDEPDAVEIDNENPSRPSHHMQSRGGPSGTHGIRTGSRSLDRPPLEPRNPLLSSYGPDSASRFNPNSSFVSTERPTSRFSRAPDVLPMHSLKAKLARETLVSQSRHSRASTNLPSPDPLLSSTLPPEDPYDNFYNPQYGQNLIQPAPQMSFSWLPPTNNNSYNYGYNPEPRGSHRQRSRGGSTERVTILPEIPVNNDLTKLQSRRKYIENQAVLMDQIVEKQRRKEEELHRKKLEDELDALRIRREAIEQMYQRGSEKHQKRLLLESLKINGSAPTLSTVGKLSLRDLKEEERLKKIKEEEEALLKKIAAEYDGVYSRFGHHVLGLRKLLEMRELDLKNELYMAKYNLMDAIRERNRQQRDIAAFKHRMLGEQALIEYERRKLHQALLGEPLVQRPIDTLYFRPDLSDKNYLEDPVFVFPKKVGKMTLDPFVYNHDEQIVGVRKPREQEEYFPTRPVKNNSILLPSKGYPEEYKDLPTVLKYGTDDPLILASKMSKSELSQERKSVDYAYRERKESANPNKKSVTFAPQDLRIPEDETLTHMIKKNDRLLKTLDEMELRELMADNDLL